ncbi:Uncharacterized protein Adt_40452 [Abeliophyllum distichum]|uniref:Transposase (putative) gypsy type domain-containing protein n=1 Tax=Abeliophyllum distichum TaxID=126358 RepID=A0ABD1QC98_9LAMI
MSSGIGGDSIGCGGGDAPIHVLPVLEGVLPIRGIDGSTGEAIPMGTTSGLREASDPYRADVVRWAAMDVPSIMKEEDLTRLREEYRIPEDIELILPGPNERACFPRLGCTALHLNAFVSGMRLPLHPMFRRILRAYDLAPTQVAPNGWSQMVGSMYLWFRHSFGMEMPLHVFQSVYQPRKLPRKKGKEEEVGWYYFCPWGSHKPLVTGYPSSIKQWKESWFWVKGNWQRVYDDPEPDLNVPSVYGIASPLPRCELSRENTDVLRRNGSRETVKYYFTPKWEEFSSHGELEDVLEASLASAIRASTLQMKVLGDFRTRMREQKKLVAQSSKADKEHQQAIEGLKAALESARTAYEQMEADLKESDSNLLNMTKQLDNANAAQKVAAEALEAANIEKKRLLEEAKSREEEVLSLRKELADAGKAKQEAEEGKKEVEAKLANAEADFVANFHNTEAYSNFSDYFARVGHQEVLTALRNDHPEVNVKDLEARFPPPDAEGEEDN